MAVVSIVCTQTQRHTERRKRRKKQTEWEFLRWKMFALILVRQRTSNAIVDVLRVKWTHFGALACTHTCAQVRNETCGEWSKHACGNVIALSPSHFCPFAIQFHLVCSHDYRIPSHSHAHTVKILSPQSRPTQAKCNSKSTMRCARINSSSSEMFLSHFNWRLNRFMLSQVKWQRRRSAYTHTFKWLI